MKGQKKYQKKTKCTIVIKGKGEEIKNFKETLTKQKIIDELTAPKTR